MADYFERFERNLGVFPKEQQIKLRHTKVFIVGVGGVGSFVATSLARSGIENFTIIDYDEYSISNVNRQILAKDKTIGRKKIEVLIEELTSINPEIKVDGIGRVLDFDEAKHYIEWADIVVASADEYAYSTHLINTSQQLGKPCLCVIPTGLWAHIHFVLPGHSSINFMESIPKFETYEELKEFYKSRIFRYGVKDRYFDSGLWRKEVYIDYLKAEFPIPQLGPMVHLASSLGALQIFNYITGKGEVVHSPRYWVIDKGSRIYINNAYRPTFKSICSFVKYVLVEVLFNLPKSLKEQLVKVWMNIEGKKVRYSSKQR